MHPTRFGATTILLLATTLTFVACDRDDEDLEPVGDYEAVEGLEQDPEADEADEDADPDEEAELADDPRKERADDADQQLRQTLMGRVMEVAQQEGFEAAVDVCHDEAGPLTEEAAEAYDVELGRVSERLRNPDNVGHDWVWEMIEEADGQPHYEANDELRAVKPIEIAEPCTNCHGDTDELADGVAQRLDEHYPEDEATGYEVGDLRGWTWVEVSE